MFYSSRSLESGSLGELYSLCQSKAFVVKGIQTGAFFTVSASTGSCFPKQMCFILVSPENSGSPDSAKSLAHSAARTARAPPPRPPRAR